MHDMEMEITTLFTICPPLSPVLCPLNLFCSGDTHGVCRFVLLSQTVQLHGGMQELGFGSRLDGFLHGQSSRQMSSHRAIPAPTNSCVPAHNLTYPSFRLSLATFIREYALAPHGGLRPAGVELKEGI
jgi:hypothetical protein